MFNVFNAFACHGWTATILNVMVYISPNKRGILGNPPDGQTARVKHNKTDKRSYRHSLGLF